MAAWSWPRSRVVRVLDGDSMDAVVVRDLGFGASATFPVRLRLNRINAAKLTTARGAAARARVVELLGDGVVDVVTVEPYKYGGPAGMAGEWMAELTLPDGANLSDVLLSERVVAPWDGRGPRPMDH